MGILLSVNPQFFGKQILAAGTGTDEQTEQAVPSDGRIQIAEAPRTDFSEVITSLQDTWKRFDSDTETFWQGVTANKRTDTEVLTFPPEAPKVARPPEEIKPQDPSKPPLPLLSIKQMRELFPELKSVVYGKTDGAPLLELNIPNSDKEFRAQYVKSIQEMAKNHGLTDKQLQEVIVKLYAFEVGGDGGFDTVSGMTKKSVSGAIDTIKNLFSDEIPLSDHNFIPTKSSAIGYKQLIMATTMGNIFTDGANMSQQLKDRANEISDPTERAKLLAKADLISKLPETMMRYARENHLKDNPKIFEDPEYKKNPEKYLEQYWKKFAPWTLFNSLSRSANPITLPDGKTITGREFTSSIHGLNLDKDLGPLIQAAQLRSLIQDWSPDSTKNPIGNESANLKSTLDGFITNVQEQIKTFDSQPLDAKMKALNSILDQTFGMLPKGVDKVMKDTILRKMSNSFQSGTAPDFKEPELKYFFDKLLLNKVFLDPNLSGKSLADSTDAQNITGLFFKLNSIYYGGLDAERLTPAVFEMANMLGAPQTRRLLDPAHSNWRTVNFTDSRGYGANQILANRSAAEALLAIHRVQNGPKADESRLGIKAFRRLFEQPN